MSFVPGAQSVPAAHPPSTAPEAEAESAQWLTDLAANSSQAQARLHAMLLRAAHAEVSRRSSRLRVSGPELDDIAQQAADDAMLAIIGKLGSFRGDSRFTTWAYKFVIFEVSSKIGRHFWANAADSLDAEHWERLPDRFGFSPEQAVQSADLLQAVRRAVDEELTEHQRTIFVAIVVNGVPLDALVAQLKTNRNAIYKSVFDARRKIRSALVAKGYIDATTKMRDTDE